MSDNFSRALSDADIRKAKPGPRPYKLTDGGGLFVLVQPNGSKLWRYKFRLAGRESLISLGSYPDLSLAAARMRHRAARQQVAEGVDPVQARKVEREQVNLERARAQVGSFQAVTDAWQAKTDPDLAENTRRRRTREIIKHLVPEFGQRPVAEITRTDLADLIKRVERRTPEIARNLRGHLSAIFEYAIDTGLVTANPVPPVRSLRKRKQTSHAALELDRIGEFLTAVAHSNSTEQTKTAMALVVLTACRKSEVCGARWSEIDLEAGDWIIPAERMKARRPHWVPLPRQAVEMLRQIRATSRSALVFPNNVRPSAPMAGATLNRLMHQLGYAETVHGFRAMFSTHFNGQGANPDVIERCLAHAPSDKVRAAYNRHTYADERRAMMQTWADLVCAMATKTPPKRG